MLPRILAIFSISVIVTKVSDGAPAVAKARQFLPAVPGYVPVYIRTGDTPLEEINPDLAEAFNSYSLKHARLAFSRSNNAITDKLDDKEIETDSIDNTKDDVRDISLDDILLEDKNDSDISGGSQITDFHYIKKIPRS